MNPSLPPPDQYPTQPTFNLPEQPSPTVMSTPHSTGPHSPASKSKFLLILAAGAALEFLIIIGLIIAVSSNSKAPVQKSKSSTSTTQSQASDVATSTSTQVINDSISQDISTLNDEQDFPASKLSDQALGL